MRILINTPPHNEYIFSHQFPVFNFYYPMQWDCSDKDVTCCAIKEWKKTDTDHIKSAALYFHFPFCETICNFCPFTRGKFNDRKIIADYLEALLTEISIKGDEKDLKSLPVRAIFVGGGTPSLLTDEEVERFGEKLHTFFDLSDLREFSFECEVKSVTKEKVDALSKIGVTNARFGLQTFDPFWRNMFGLTASLDQIYEACDLFNTHLPNTSFDILYSMNGQTDKSFFSDLDKATNMGNSLIDIYPIDNVVTQTKLHKKMCSLALKPTSAQRRFLMNRQLRKFMKERNFLPHNGHGYVKVSQDEINRDPVVTNKYTFEYHKHVYGYDTSSVIGFGVNAISILPGCTLTNTNNRLSYISDMRNRKTLAAQVAHTERGIDASRPIVTHLPYHGHLKKEDVKWDLVPKETINALSKYQEVGLVEDEGKKLTLTKDGWEWYVKMYYAMPKSQKKILDAFVMYKLRGKDRRSNKRASEL